MERIIKGSDTIIEIGFGERTYGFHRDPTWPEIDTGAITVEWVNSESPVVTCYSLHAEYCSTAVKSWRVLKKVFEPWERGEIEDIESSRANQIINREWTEMLDPNTGSLTIKSIDSFSLGSIIIRAKPISIVHPPLNGN